MSITKMRKMSLLCLERDKSKLLRIFIKSGCVELTGKEEVEKDVTLDGKLSHWESNRYKVLFGLQFLKQTAKDNNLLLKGKEKKKQIKVNLKRENRLVAYEEYMAVAREEVEILSKVSDMEHINNRMTDIKSEISKIESIEAQIAVYKEIALPNGTLPETKYTVSFLGTVPTEQAENLSKTLPHECMLESATSDKVTAVLLCCHKDYRKLTEEALNACEFIPSSFTLTCSPLEQIAIWEEKKKQLAEESLELSQKAKHFIDMTETLKILYDYYTLEIEKAQTTRRSRKTQKTVLYEGWIPQDKEKKIAEQIEKECPDTVWECRDPLDSEKPPTLTKNNKVVSVFDGITDMFGAPSYRERDPKIFVAFYYFLIFGFMLGDAGYGLIMAIACFAFTAWKKPVKNSGQMMIMFAFCGISTLIWGTLFGGWFGAIPSFMQKAHLYWFQPLEEPLTMFALALGVGMLQIGTGFALHGVATIEQGGIKNILLGVTKDFGWVFIFIGMFLFSPSLLSFLGIIGEVTGGVATLVEVGKYITLVGAGMMLLSGVIGKKNPIKAVGGVFGNAYGAINVVSDLLSYSRLFGLGLTSGVIGYVVNMLATLIVNTFFGGLWVGWIVAVPVLIVGHVFNLAINLLGAYVHDSRLQYIEFFGRFYDGSGHAFLPIGSSVKYTYLNN